jgi:rubrerythrin
MVSVCPRCHKVIDEGAVCCAELRCTWKCGACAELITGFVVPFNRCFLCGGELDLLKKPDTDKADAVQVIEEAMQFEINTLQYYRMARIKARDAHQRAVFDRFAGMERGHIVLLEKKYHIHLDPRVLDMPFDAEQSLVSWLFKGINFDAPEGNVRPLYLGAIEMEQRTRDHFRQRGASLPAGTEKNICLELAAEEEEHVGILEAELAHLDAADDS